MATDKKKTSESTSAAAETRGRSVGAKSTAATSAKSEGSSPRGSRTGTSSRKLPTVSVGTETPKRTRVVAAEKDDDSGTKRVSTKKLKAVEVTTPEASAAPKSKSAKASTEPKPVKSGVASKSSRSGGTDAVNGTDSVRTARARKSSKTSVEEPGVVKAAVKAVAETVGALAKRVLGSGRKKKSDDGNVVEAQGTASARSAENNITATTASKGATSKVTPQNRDVAKANADALLADSLKGVGTGSSELARPVKSEEEIPPAPAPTEVREHFSHDRHAHAFPPPPRDLPNDYGDTRLRVLVRDPEWVYAYWEVNDATRGEFQIPRAGHNRKLVLRFYKISGRNWPDESAHYFFDVDISPYAPNWYIKLPETNQRWISELGVFDEQGSYLPITRSNLVVTPRDTVSEDMDSQWMTVEETYQRLYGLSGGYAIGGRLSTLTAGGSELLVRDIQRQISPMLHGRTAAMSSGLFSGSSESISFSGNRDKGFWLQVHTELILYGATEPDARVTVQGRPVELKPDGTFSLRFALPDGEQILDVRAVNADGDMSREVTPIVTRRTEGNAQS